MAEDYFTSTVDGAAGWARCHAEPDFDNDRPSPWDLGDYPEDDEEDEDEDECNCSDPGCPCGGIKRGGV
jgi:hypothetical protein